MDEWGSEYLELRSRHQLDDRYPFSDHKVSMTVALAPDPEQIWAGFKPGHVKEIRRAYFRISKDFHPDRFFGRSLGTYKDRLALIFERVSRAWSVLGDETQRAVYDGRAGRPAVREDGRRRPHGR